MTKKSSNFMRYFSLSLVLMMFLILAPILEANAGTGVNAYVSGDDIAGGSNTYAEGISANKSGYMIYLVDSNGNRVSPDAKLVSSSGHRFNTGAQWSANARLGGYSVNSSTPIFKFNVQWGAPFTFSGGFVTREAEIKKWMAESKDGVTNAQMLIQGYWGSSYAEAWVKNNYYLVLEPIYEYRMWYRYDMKVIVRGVPDSGSFQSRSGAPVMVGNVPGLAQMSNDFLSSLKATTISPATGVYVFKVPKTGFTSSGMSSGYAKAFPRMEYLTKTIGSVRAGTAGTGFLSLSEIKSAGWGMMALSASDLGSVSPTTPVTPVTPEDHAYDGTIYTLTAAGGSYSSGSGSSATTDFGNGSGSCLSGTFYAENCASENKQKGYSLFKI